MTTKDYNALAAEMMGWEAKKLKPIGSEILEDSWVDQDGWWVGPEFDPFNPLENRNQTYQLLKRAEELGLADEVAVKIEFHKDCPDLLDVSSSFGMSGCSCDTLSTGVFWLLTCPTDIIVMACVDVWETWQAEQKAKAALHEK